MFFAGVKSAVLIAFGLNADGMAGDLAGACPPPHYELSVCTSLGKRLSTCPQILLI